MKTHQVPRYSSQRGPMTVADAGLSRTVLPDCLFTRPGGPAHERDLRYKRPGASSERQDARCASIFRSSFSVLPSRYKPDRIGVILRAEPHRARRLSKLARGTDPVRSSYTLGQTFLRNKAKAKVTLVPARCAHIERPSQLFSRGLHFFGNARKSCSPAQVVYRFYYI